MPEETSPWMRITIEVEGPALNLAGVKRWVRNVVEGEDGEITVEPIELAMTPWTISYGVEEYEGPPGPSFKDLGLG